MKYRIRNFITDALTGTLLFAGLGAGMFLLPWIMSLL